jgi:3'(2'), 5'-bisphosphate nucleotidase
VIDKNIEFEQFVNGILDLSGEIALNNFRKIRDLTLKGDFSPVTKADEDIEQFIRDKIFEKYPNHKIIGEELDDFKGSENITWYIDPIDGTYDYINDLDEFTLNAGLIINNRAVAGIIYAPAKNRLFYSYEKGCSFEIINSQHVKLDCSKISNNKLKFVSYSNKLKPEINKIYQ